MNVQPQPHAQPEALRLPDADALVLGPAGGVVVTAEGEILHLDAAGVRRRLGRGPVLMVHAAAAGRRHGTRPVAAFDLLELFAFVLPARFCRPTPAGLAEVLDLPAPGDLEAAAALLPRIAHRLLRILAAPGRAERSDPAGIAAAMGGGAGAGEGGWLWAPFILAALARDGAPPPARQPLQIWHRLPEWEAEGPRPPPTAHAVDPAAARRRLAAMLGEGAEPRPQQSDYASAVAAAFAPRPAPDAPHLVLAEAGTGTGKTLGYLAPATLWAEANGAPVWISTYTRNLQQQIEAELERLIPDPARRARRVVIRKGRENYLCLLNLEEATRAIATAPHLAVPIGLMARWAAATRDGDLTGAGFPGWLSDILGRAVTLGLADRRGECIHSACPHWSRCFIEHGIRRARAAEIVVANHALVMVQAALGGGEDGTLPPHLVFDEGHHLFDAADGTFAAHLTAVETAELRRWLLGPEGGGGRRSSRARGLRRRIEDLLPDEAAAGLVAAVERAARALPGPGWGSRIAEDRPDGPAEAFLARARLQVHARAQGVDGPYAIECDTTAPVEGLVAAASALASALAGLERPMLALAKALRARLDDEAEELDSALRQRLDAAARAIERRARTEVAAWRQMLATLAESADGSAPKAMVETMVDWLGVERAEGRELDVGFYRHWIDPTAPFAAAVARPTQGLVVTSATLTDGTGDAEADWQAAEDRTGAHHLPLPAIRARVPSPFDYAAQTRVLVVRDVRKDDLDQVAAAYRALFLAAGGGGLGLFTAVSRLRAVHGRIAPAFEAAGLPLYAQHVDGMEVGTLVDIFRGETDACLLGTDAVRDGVDVPGRSLRAIVFDRVPWPRPDILFRARAAHFGRQRWTDMQTRLRLKQAFGRLVRRADDQGVFVLLDPMMPTRLAGAFPPEVEIQRIGLAEAVAITKRFLRAG